MSLIGAYRQTVKVSDVVVSIRDLSIRQSCSQRTLEVQFNSDSDIDSNIATLASVGAAVEIEIKLDEDTKTFHADIASVHKRRTNNVTEFRIECEGREARLRRRRFSGQWTAIRVDEVITDAFDQFGGGLGLTLAALPEGPLIDEISTNEGTLFELFDELASFADWAWAVADDEISFWDPETDTATRSISQADHDIGHGTLDFREDATHIQNAARGVAYERRTIQQQKDVAEGQCITSVHFPRPKGFGWEVYDELAEFGEDEIFGSTDLEAGVFNFSSPQAMPSSGRIDLAVKIRRPVVFEIINQDSIDVYGPRYAPTYSDDGGLTVEAVQKLMQHNIDRRSQPEVSISLEVTRWPFDVERRCQVTLTDPELSDEMIVDSISIQSGQRDATVSLELVEVNDRRSVLKPDPSVVMAKRIEALEKKGFHPTSQIGRMLNEVGLISFQQITQIWEWSGEFDQGLYMQWSDGSGGLWSNDDRIRWTAG